MIVDSLDNIEFYRNILPDIHAGLAFIKAAPIDIPLGEYVINERAKAFVSEYETVAEFRHGFEAHRRMIDIQYPLVGEERIKWTPLAELATSTPYDEEKDRCFLRNPAGKVLNVDTGNGVFAIFFPTDAHGPQHFITSPMHIRKMTIKVCVR